MGGASSARTRCERAAPAAEGSGFHWRCAEARPLARVHKARDRPHLELLRRGRVVGELHVRGVAQCGANGKEG